jgi:signal transduction histidine kinase
VQSADGVDPETLGALATRAGALLEHRRVLHELERAVVSGVAAEERMLGRIGLDIHDGPTQQMSVALLEVQLLQAEIEDAQAAGGTVPEGLPSGLLRIYETLGGALHELRELIGTLRPAQFQGRSLEDIVREAGVGFEARTGIEVSVEITGDTAADGITLTQRITFFRILQEALANAHRHGRARHAWVRLDAAADATNLEVVDDGCGFDPSRLSEEADGLRVQIGLAGMRDRARLVGGACTIESSPGAGTTVRVNIPHWHPVNPTA